jgi:hypothetical protein
MGTGTEWNRIDLVEVELVGFLLLDLLDEED